MKHLSCLWVASLVCAVTASGCGLVLDTQPRDNRVDTGMGEADGGDLDGEVMTCAMDEECQNGNVCDGRETCVEGTCVGSDALLQCNDGIPCTVDSCDPQTGCDFRPDDSLCADGFCFDDIGCSATRRCDSPSDCGRQDACIGVFECVDEVCQRAAPLTCEDNGCLVGACIHGGCVYAPDSARCNPNETGCTRSRCQTDGQCSPPEPDDSLCDDSIDCTDDSCVIPGQTGAAFCVNTPNHEFCDDFIDCTDTFCAPEDPTSAAVGRGCAIRLNDGVCAELGGFEGCVTPICLPSGCSDGVYVQPCPEGGVCDVTTGECDDSVPCGTACVAAGSPCAPTVCNTDSQTCVPDANSEDPCASSVVCTTGFCNVSGAVPRCDVRPDPECSPPIDLSGTPVP